jgi:excisionase family DNA binding protein
MSEILNIEEACQFLRIAKPTLYRYLRRGGIPGFKMGRDWKFHRELLEDWLKQQILDSSLNRSINHKISISEKSEQIHEDCLDVSKT